MVNTYESGDVIEDVVCQGCGKMYDEVELSFFHDTIDEMSIMDSRLLGWRCDVCGERFHVAKWRVD